MSYLSEQNIFIFLVQIFLLLGLARGLGETFRRWSLPSFTGEILVGIFLGPTIFGRFSPWLYQFVFPADVIQQNMLDTVAWLGALFLLLQTGLEMDFSSAVRQGRDALKIALTDTVVPITISFIACLYLPDSLLVDPSQRILFAIFMATAMTISEMAITARALHDLNIFKTDLGFLIVSALSINDIIGWFIFTIVIGLSIHAQLNLIGIALIGLLTFGFTFLCLTLGKKMVDRAISEIKAKKDDQPMTTLTFVCLLGLFCGAIVQRIGIHALFGFFIAGIMAGSARALSERTRHVVSQMVHAIFVPLFFTSIGLKIDFLKHFNVSLILFVLLISIAGKFLGAWLGALFTKTPKANRLAIAIAHTPGGIMQIVIGLLALQYHLISEAIFIALVFSAMVSSVLLGPWLSYAIRKRKEISILELFSHRAIIADMRACDRDGAIHELCNFAAEQEHTLDRHEIYKKVIERENAMGTGIEEGIAVPHARLSFLKKPCIFFGRSASGFDWNSPDGKPVRFIFLILTPEHEDDMQVQILSSIAKAMISKNIRYEISIARDKQDVWQTLNEAFTSQIIARK